MPDEAMLTPVPGDDPCGTDLRWDAAFMALEHAFERALTRNDGDVVSGERAATNVPTFKDVIVNARELMGRTKDMRVLTVYVEALWHDAGLPTFAAALEDLVAVAETWADPDTGFFPRADEEDGDLSERVAPLGKLLNRIAATAEIVGWGSQPGPDERDATRESLAAVFGAWNERLDAAFGPDLPSPTEAWTALRELVGDPVAAPDSDAAGAGADVSMATEPATMDAWDAVERAVRLMEQQNGHSPAVPVLRLVLRWRSVDIMEISQTMRGSGVSLEQLLDSVRSQLTDAG